MAETIMLDVPVGDWVQGATEMQDFMAQNPEAGNMLYVVNAAVKPETDSQAAGWVSGKRVPPYGFYGRSDTASQTVLQGVVWFRADKPMKMPIDK